MKVFIDDLIHELKFLEWY